MGSRGSQKSTHGTRQTSLESTLKGSQKSRSVPIFRIVLNAGPIELPIRSTIFGLRFRRFGCATAGYHL